MKRMFAAAALLAVFAASAFAQSPPKLQPIPNRYIVTFPRATADAGALAEAIARDHGGNVLAVWRHALKGFWIELPAANASRLASDPRVVRVEEDALIYDSASQPTGPNSQTPKPTATWTWPNPADPLWHLTRIGHRTGEPTGLDPAGTYYTYNPRFDGSWMDGTTKRRVRVYLVDTGVWKHHIEFQGRLISGGYNAAVAPEKTEYGALPVMPVPLPPDPSPADDPCVPTPGYPVGLTVHGTWAAPFVLGNWAGVAKEVELIPVTSLSCADGGGHTSTAVLIGALDWVLEDWNGKAAPKPAVLSISTYRVAGVQKVACSGSCAADEIKPNLTALEQAVHDIVQAGIPVVASANNHNNDACHTTPARMNIRGGHPLGSKVISVGGTSPGDTRWITDSSNASNHGQCVDIWAPASHLTVARSPESIPNANNKGLYHDNAAYYSGTSYSAPIVAGMVARLLAEDPLLYDNAATTAQEVWDRLAANASVRTIDTNPGSPRLLAYLGGVTFKKQPQSQVVGGASATLTTEIIKKAGETVTYEWYKGTHKSATAATKFAETSTTDAANSVTVNVPVGGGDYWVRVKNGVFYADSEVAHVSVSTCVVPKITSQPKSQWVDVDAHVELSATINSGTGTACWEWREVGATTALKDGRITGTGPAVLTYDKIPTTAVGRKVYQLIVKECGLAADAEAACTVTSDTAQVRVYMDPPQPVLRLDSTVIDKPVVLDRTFVLRSDELEVNNPPNSYQPVWLYSNDSATSIEDMKPLYVPYAEGGWRVDLSNLFPTKTGKYAVAYANESDLIRSKGSIYIDKICTYAVRLNNDYPNVTVTPGTPVTVSATDYRSTGMPALTNLQWTVPPGVPQPAVGTRTWTFTAPNLTRAKSYTFRATDAPRGCVQENTVSVTPSTDPRFKVLAGLCQNVSVPEAEIRLGATAKFTAVAQFNDVAIDTSNLMFEWHRGDELLDSGLGKNTLSHVVTQATASLDLTVTVSGQVNGGFLVASAIIRVSLSQADPCPAGVVCEVSCYKRRRAVRHAGAPITFYVYEPGETVTFTVPEEIAGATHEWHRRTAVNSDEVVGTGSSLTTTLHDNSTLWVYTNTAGQQLASDTVEIISDVSSDSSETWDQTSITPAVQTVTPGSTITIQASFLSDVPAGATLTYEWHEGANYNTASWVIATGQTLSRKVYGDSVFWCRIKLWTSATQYQTFDTRFASVSVPCTSTVSGIIRAQGTSTRVARNQRPTLIADGYGTGLTYSWYSQIPGQPRVPTGSWWNSINPAVTAPVTYFGATATDSCGTTGEMQEIAVHLCVATITQQPAAKIIVTPQGKLANGQIGKFTVAASPAIDGQVLTTTWHRDSDPYQITPLTDADPSPTVFQPPLPAAGSSATFYAAVKSDCSGSPHVVKSTMATVEVCTPPTVYGNTDASVNITAGGSRILTLSASGKELTYQWYFGQSGDTTQPWTGRTTASVTVSPTSDTSYWCRVTSQGTCHVNGPTTTVRVCRAPSITAQPQSTSVFANKTATLSIAIDNGTNTQTPQYQWYQQTSTGAWNAISGQTSASYVTPAMTEQATYMVGVTVGACKVTSTAATVSICAYNETVSGSTHNIGHNESGSLSLPVMSPVLEKTITWYRGASGDRTAPVRTGTGTNLTYNTPLLTANAQYWAEFSTGGCVSRTTTYNVNVCRPSITTQPANKIVPPGGSTTLTVVAAPIAGLTYQWYTGTPGNTGSPVPGGTNASLTVTPQATTTYWVRITGTCNPVATVDSTAATVTICTVPSIWQQPFSQNLTSSATATLSVNANGDGLSYQWYEGVSGVTTTPIGTNSDVLTVKPGTTRSFWVRVSGTCGTVNSNTAVLSVYPTIGTQPADAQICNLGDNASFSITASGSNLTYVWYRRVGTGPWEVLPDNGPTMTTAIGAVPAYVYAAAKSGNASTYSNTVTVTLGTKPVITSISRYQSYPGTYRLTANVSAEDQERGVSYTWYKGASGDTSTPIGTYYQITVTPTPPQTYWVRVRFDDTGCHSDRATSF
jgi:Subtilase family/Ig-like domain CHU_C associated